MEQKGDTGAGNGWDNQRRHQGRAGLFWVEWVDKVILYRRQMTERQWWRMGLNLESGLAGMEEVVVFFWAGEQERNR